jgi:hypothetical protein
MNKTLAMELQDLREEIAREIEKIQPNTNMSDIKFGYAMARNYSAAIARGKSVK